MTGCLLAVLLAYPTWHEDAQEPEADRHWRLGLVALGTDEAAESDEERAALVVLARYEGALARRWQASECRGAECDHGRARSLWQLHASPLVPPREWRGFVGLGVDAQLGAAAAAARVYRHARRACGTIEGALSMYATGQGCRWKPAAARAREVRRVLAKLRECRAEARGEVAP